MTEYEISKIKKVYEGWKPEANVLNIGLSHKCNLQCKYCPYHGENGHLRKSEKVFMSWDVTNAIAELARRVNTISKLRFVGRGEPMLNPDWYKMIMRILNESNVDDLTMYTNGTLLNDENILALSEIPYYNLELRISIDGTSAEENDFFRGGTRIPLL